jgi:RNA ligase
VTAFVDKERLDAMVDEGWLRSQRHPEADRWIYNYTEKTQYEDHWTPETLACRGLILDSIGGIHARPFGKFFNYGAPQVPVLPDEDFTVTEKIDGSLGILYWLGGEVHIATRGSFTSEQALEGTRMLQEQTIVVQLGTTPLFEIVYPENRIVVDYGGRRELVLLGSIDNDTGLDAKLPEYSGPKVDRHDHTDLQAMVNEDRSNCEGYVICFESGLRLKIKHAEYVRLHRLITGINARHIWEALKEGDDLEAMLEGLPDEMHEWIEETAAEIRADYYGMALEAHLAFSGRPETDDRKALAEYFQGTGFNTAVLFRILDGRPHEDLIWKAIKPEPKTPDTIWTGEAVAA